jgi:uncharacterized protein YecE (DUF72 family)
VRGRTVAERFNYLYSEEELREISGTVQELAGQANETHVVYNNNASDYAIRSAQRFKEMLQSIPGLQVPGPKSTEQRGQTDLFGKVNSE